MNSSSLFLHCFCCLFFYNKLVKCHKLRDRLQYSCRVKCVPIEDIGVWVLSRGSVKKWGPLLLFAASRVHAPPQKANWGCSRGERGVTVPPTSPPKPEACIVSRVTNWWCSSSPRLWGTYVHLKTVIWSRATKNPGHARKTKKEVSYLGEDRTTKRFDVNLGPELIKTCRFLFDKQPSHMWSARLRYTSIALHFRLSMCEFVGMFKYFCFVCVFVCYEVETNYG